MKCFVFGEKNLIFRFTFCVLHSLNFFERSTWYCYNNLAEQKLNALRKKESEIAI